MRNEWMTGKELFIINPIKMNNINHSFHIFVGFDVSMMYFY